MSFDNLCKLLSEKYPDRFVNWLLGETPQTVTVLKTELSIEPIRADSVTFLQTDQRIVHLEFQTRIESNPPCPSGCWITGYDYTGFTGYPLPRL